MMGYEEEVNTDAFPIPVDVTPEMGQCFNEIRGWAYRERHQPWFVADAFAHWCVSEHYWSQLRYGQMGRLFAQFESNVNNSYSYRMAHQSRLIGDGWTFPASIRLS